MNGIDEVEPNISLHRVEICGKKCYFPIGLLTYFIDLSEQNAWKLYEAQEVQWITLSFDGKLKSLLERNRITGQGKVVLIDTAKVFM